MKIKTKTSKSGISHKDKSILLVHGTFSIKTIRNHLNEKVKIIPLDVNAENILRKNNIIYTALTNYNIPDSNKNCVDWMNDWSTKPIDGKNTIKDLLVYDNFSYWWCMEQWLYYSFLYRDPFNKIIEATDTVSTILEKENPKEIYFLEDNTLWGKTIRIIAAKDYLLRPIKCKRPLLLELEEQVRPAAIKQFFRWHTRARKLVWALERKKQITTENTSDAKKILAVCTYRWEKFKHPALSDAIDGDPYISPILEQLKDAHVTYVDATQRTYVGFKILRNKAKSEKNHIILEKYLNFSDIRKAKKITKILLSRIKKVMNSKQFINSWRYGRYNLWPVAAAQFLAYYKYRIEGHIIDYICAEKLIEKEEPDVFMYPGESGDLSYIFFKICKEKNIPCVGIQHGTLGYSPLAIHKKEDFQSGKNTSLPIPTYLFLYGSYYKDFLSVTGNYPSSNLEVTGNIRFDHFIDKLPTKKELLKKYRMNLGQPILLFVTQMLPYPAEEEVIARSIFDAAKKLKYQLIIKQHPGEPSDALYKKLSKEYKMHPLITKYSSTKELSYISDIMIGFESTVNYDAMIFNTPIINMNFGNRKNWLPFAEKGAAYQVSTPQEVLPAIYDIMHNESTRARLRKNMEKLLYEDCYKIDGKAALRATQIIRKLLKK